MSRPRLKDGPQRATVTVTEEVINLLDKSSSPRSHLVRLAILEALKKPEILGLAINDRVTRSNKEEFTKMIQYNFSVNEAIERLKNLTKLGGSDVVRLAIEAYVYEL